MYKIRNNLVTSKKEVKNNIERHPVPVLGKNFKVQIEYKNIKITELNIYNNTINIALPKKYKKMSNEEILDLAILKMYEQIAIIEVETIMEKVRLMMKMAPEDYEIIHTKNILANCINSKIIINPKIVMFNRDVIEYIIVHEFCHLKYKNHVKGFKEMIDKYVPNYEKYEKIIGNKYKI